MNIQVRYYTRSGNTKKLADAVANAVGATAQDVTANLTEKADVLLLGSSLYAGGCDKAVATFLEENKDNIGVLVCFGSSASGKSTHAKISKLAHKLGITVCEEYFNCAGHFLFMHKQRPNEQDLAAVADFAQGVISKLSD